MMGVLTGKRRRWWEEGDRSVEAEQAWFEEDELDFRLNKQLFEQHEVVVFRGHLRLGNQKTPASVHFPPSYGIGAHPVVVAPDLKLGRHQSPDGALCLDHPGLGEAAPMYGGEAVLRAERLWHLWENDREELQRLEADAPDPRANYYEYQPESAITLIDVDVTDHSSGFVRLGVLSLEPMRAGVTQVRTSQPIDSTLTLGPGGESFAGPMEVNGVWKRIDEAPPPTQKEFLSWAQEKHASLIEDQIKLARAAGHWANQPDYPAVVAFVYPDEGPRRNEVHDAWLFLTVDPQGKTSLPRAFHLRSDERWLRQPQLEPLQERRVAVVGVGALGSMMTDLFAKAGVSNLFMLDSDISTPGNRVRHQLDLTELGRAKVQGMAARVLRVNPWSNVEIQGVRLGGALPDQKVAQEVDDALMKEFANSDLIVNATAAAVARRDCSRIGREIGKPVLHVWVSAGAWGARILLQRPGESGCTECLALSQKSPPLDVEVPPISDDPAVQEVVDRGCADPSFTGPGFELAAASAAATRVAIQSLLHDEETYPPADFDLVTLIFRDLKSAMPEAVYTRLPVHPDCTLCH
jgi:molybdopterin/thiamine biosynthesis adenylyltransferase